MKYKIWNKVKYLKNTTGSDAIIWKAYYITEIEDDNQPYSLWKEKWIYENDMRVKEEDIELVEEAFTPWEQVAVSNDSIKKAIQDLLADRYKEYYIWKTKKWEYVTELDVWDIKTRKYIAKIPKEEKKERKIECTDKKWEEIKNILKLK